MLQKWLSCLVGPGQFPNEYAVSGVQYNGKGFSLFAPHDTVEPVAGENEGRGVVRVDVLEERGGLALVRLPAQTLENGQYVTVKASELVTGPPAQKVPA